LFGENGKHLTIDVPCGITVVTDKGVVIGEVNNPDDTLCIARGGKGASSKNNYKKQIVEGFSVNLDLKMIADIGLIGFKFNYNINSNKK
jgi:GTPase involved in cell partitioning and DNA repair